eukprot:TRINITY_DN13724_c0_g1_i3.p1 TRINITY_DN13724_c0_g1~~TRINITY_DN13724_c0_g1_i3.p1  ORF type:complete len:424 (+),score=55.89 TRINITY_DN13724_c0_g1_i3:244-1515(+)
MLLYIITHLLDPGYVPTEQTISDESAMSQRYTPKSTIAHLGENKQSLLKGQQGKVFQFSKENLQSLAEAKNGTGATNSPVQKEGNQADPGQRSPEDLSHEVVDLCPDDEEGEHSVRIELSRLEDNPEEQEDEAAVTLSPAVSTEQPKKETSQTPKSKNFSKLNEESVKIAAEAGNDLENIMTTEIDNGIPQKVKLSSREVHLVDVKRANSNIPQVLVEIGTAPNSAEIQIEPQSSPDYIERRYCNRCFIEQPLRAKHCKDCNRCVAMYDHHCPWLGTCIGEKNHGLFLVFLILQSIQLSVAAVKIVSFYIPALNQVEFSTLRHALMICDIVIITFFLLMVMPLFCFHSYLMVVNLTTWEHLSWRKISYLKDLPIQNGSPFDQGCVKNISSFCCEPLKSSALTKWTFKDTEIYQSKHRRNFSGL